MTLLRVCELLRFGLNCNCKTRQYPNPVMHAHGLCARTERENGTPVRVPFLALTFQAAFVSLNFINDISNTNFTAKKVVRVFTFLYLSISENLRPLRRVRTRLPPQSTDASSGAAARTRRSAPPRTRAPRTRCTRASTTSTSPLLT